MPRASRRAAYIVTQLEQFFLDCVTQTPLRIEYTAADVGVYLGESTSTISGWLQTYRDVNRGRISGVTAEYVISTFERGPRSVWFIQSWSGITKRQQRTAHTLMMVYSGMTVLREEIRPMLKNVEAEFISVALHDQPVAHEFVPMYLNKLAAYRMMLLGVQSDLSNITILRLRPIAVGMSGEVAATINRIANIEAVLQRDLDLPWGRNQGNRGPGSAEPWPS